MKKGVGHISIKMTVKNKTIIGLKLKNATNVYTTAS